MSPSSVPRLAMAPACCGISTVGVVAGALCGQSTPGAKRHIACEHGSVANFLLRTREFESEIRDAVNELIALYVSASAETPWGLIDGFLTFKMRYNKPVACFPDTCSPDA